MLYRPQVLILLKSNDALQPEHPRMLSLARQLKAGERTARKRIENSNNETNS
jgi:hypothetical protein